MKTLIAVPCMDQVAAQFAQSLAMLKKVGDCVVSFQVGSLVYNSRNSLALKAVALGCDYVLWLDSDMLFPPETLEYMVKVLEENKLDILSGLYFRRVPPFSPVVFSKVNIDDMTWGEPKEIPEDLFEVEGIGFGCCLTRVSTLFEVQAEYNTMFQPLNGFGEDLSFCWRARQIGHKIWVDPHILCGHVGHQVITKEFYDLYNSAKIGKE